MEENGKWLQNCHLFFHWKYRQYTDIHGCVKGFMASCIEILQNSSQEVFINKALGRSGAKKQKKKTYYLCEVTSGRGYVDWHWLSLHLLHQQQRFILSAPPCTSNAETSSSRSLNSSELKHNRTREHVWFSEHQLNREQQNMIITSQEGWPCAVFISKMMMREIGFLENVLSFLTQTWSINH